MRMEWSSWVWIIPPLALVIGLAAPWVLLVTGRVWFHPEANTILFALLGQAAILALASRYLKSIGLWLVCMTRRNRVCLQETEDGLWYIDPSLLSFARSDIESVRPGPQSGSTHTVEIVLKGRGRPVTINARHFEGGVSAVTDFLTSEKPARVPTSKVRPWG